MASGHVRPRKNAAGKITSWAFVYEPDRLPGQRRQPQWKSGFRTRKEAERALRELLAEVQRGTYREPTRLLVSELFQRWLEYKRPRVRPETYSNYAFVVRHHLSPEFGQLPLAQLGAAQIDAYFSRVMPLQGAPTRTKSWAVLGRALKQAVKWDLLPHNPCDKATPPSSKDAPRSKGRALTPEERKTVLEELEGWLWAAAVVAAGTGLRRGEILGLKWSDIDWEAQTLRVERAAVYLLPEVRPSPDAPNTIAGPPKSASSRGVVRFGDAVLQALRIQKAELAAFRLQAGAAFRDEGWIFPRPDGGLRNPCNLSNAWLRARKALGITCRFHDLRHDHATTLLEARVPLVAVSKRLRHSDPSITARVYAHVTDRMEEEAVEAGEAALQEALEGRKRGKK